MAFTATFQTKCDSGASERIQYATGRTSARASLMMFLDLSKIEAGQLRLSLADYSVENWSKWGFIPPFESLRGPKRN